MIGEDPVPGGRRGGLFDLRCLDIHTLCGNLEPPSASSASSLYLLPIIFFQFSLVLVSPSCVEATNPGAEVRLLKRA